MSKLTHSIYLTVIAILGAAIIWLVCDVPTDTVQETETRFTISSIAVLPFVAVGSEDSSKQVAETITSRLIETLRNKPHLIVASENQSRAFAESNSSISEIGGKLSVSTILEGSVRRTQDRVRVVAQLIDVRTDAHMWAQAYDREIGDLDYIVADIERTISTYVRD